MKKIIILIIINLFSFNSVGYAAIDCVNPEKMSEKFKCKLSSFKKSNKDNDGKEKKFGFKNPFKKLNEWNKNNKTLADVIK
ncbi:hypothetical protein OAJ49_00365 [bacterium]|nr:hypothetical protein [bacterium]